MAISTTAGADDLGRTHGIGDSFADSRVIPTTDRRPPHGAVSWGAIAAGAAAAAALSLILLILGVGLGLSSVSPWAQQGASADTIGVSTIVWLTLTSLLASAMGGYLAGRLRTRWTNLHGDEVYFRDTAHGFLSWAVATLATGALLTSVIGSILDTGAQAGAAVVSGVAGTATAAVAGGAAASTRDTGGNAGSGGPMAYFVDSLFRRDAAAMPVPAPVDGSVATPVQSEANDRNTGRDTAEITRIFVNASWTQPLPAEDIRYVGQIVAQRTGLSQPDAEKRVADVYAKGQAKLRAAEVSTREAADQARKAAAYSALWLFISLLGGAFVASLAATFGGRRRDA
jgi:hypothetical protein